MGIECPDWLCRECDVCDKECSLECELDYKCRCSDCVLFDTCFPKE